MGGIDKVLKRERAEAWKIAEEAWMIAEEAWKIAEEAEKTAEVNWEDIGLTIDPSHI